MVYNILLLGKLRFWVVDFRYMKFRIFWFRNVGLRLKLMVVMFVLGL